jgi:hypothetical protein
MSPIRQIAMIGLIWLGLSVPAPGAVEIQAKFAGPHGVVRDAQGNAVEGATVVLYYVHSRWGLGNRTIQSVTTDAEGNFAFADAITFENLSATDYTDYYLLIAKLAGEGPGWSEILSDGPAASYDLTLTPVGKPQTVRVTDATTGKPIKGAKVFPTSVGSTTDTTPAFRKTIYMPSGLRAITSGTFKSRNRASPRAGWLILPRVTPDGRPAPDIWVEVDGIQTGDGRYSVITQADGLFETWLPVGLPNQQSNEVALKTVDRDGRWASVASSPFTLTVGGEQQIDLKLSNSATSAPASQP